MVENCTCLSYLKLGLLVLEPQDVLSDATWISSGLGILDSNSSEVDIEISSPLLLVLGGVVILIAGVVGGRLG